MPAVPAPRAAVGAAHPGPVPGRAAGRRPARLHRSPRPPGRRAGHRPRAGLAGTPGPDTGPGSVARRSQPGSGPGGRAGRSRQSAGAAEQFHRPGRRAGTGARVCPRQPAGDADWPGRDGQDPPGGGGRRRPARRVPRRRLARRARQRRRARRGWAGRGRRARRGSVCARGPSASGIGRAAHRAPPGRTVAGRCPRQLRARHRRGGRAGRHPRRGGAGSPAYRHEP